MSLPVQSSAWLHSRLFPHFVSVDWLLSPLGFAHVAHLLPWQAPFHCPHPLGSGLCWGCLTALHLLASESCRTNQCLPPHRWESKALVRQELCRASLGSHSAGASGQVIGASLCYSCGALPHPVFSRGSTGSGRPPTVGQTKPL